MLYQTTIQPIYGDYEAIDTILKKVYKFERVKGTIRYFTDVRSGTNLIRKTIELDDSGKIR